jgi:type I restriction enzyme M protein
VNEKGKVTKSGAKDRLKAIEGYAESEEERDTLMRCLALIEAESELSKVVSQAQAALDGKVLARYGKLTETEIKTVVVEDKWLASLRAAIEGEVQRLTQQLASRVRQLEERYSRPLPELERKVEAFSANVYGHLKKMGLSWS